MAISPYVARLRQAIGNEYLLVPCATVLPRDADGRVLLVRHADFGTWGTIGGSIEPDEAPADAARREAQEEAGIEVELGEILGVVGGPEYRLTYPNGDVAGCVIVVYDALVVRGTPTSDGDETTEVAWFSPDELRTLDIGALNRRLLQDVGALA